MCITYTHDTEQEVGITNKALFHNLACDMHLKVYYIYTTEKNKKAFKLNRTNMGTHSVSVRGTETTNLWSNPLTHGKVFSSPLKKILRPVITS